MSVLLGACGGSSSPGSTAVTSGIELKTGPQINAAAYAAARSAKSVHVKGNAGTTEIELSIGENGTIGTVGVDGGKVDLLRLGDKSWVKGDAAFWAKNGVPAASVTKLNGKYVDVSGQPGQFDGFSSVSSFFATTSLASKTTKGETTSVNGARVITLKDTDASLLFVALDGEPFPMRVISVGANGGQIDFTDWNVPVTITAPTADQIVDVKTLTG